MMNMKKWMAGSAPLVTMHAVCVWVMKTPANQTLTYHITGGCHRLCYHSFFMVGS